MILNLSNVFPSPHDLVINATFDAEQKALFYANRTGTWTAGSPNSVAFLPLTNYTGRASALVAAYAAHSPTAHLRAGLEATVVAGFTKQRQVLLKHLRTAEMAAMVRRPSPTFASLALTRGRSSSGSRARASGSRCRSRSRSSTRSAGDSWR